MMTLALHIRFLDSGSTSGEYVAVCHLIDLSSQKFPWFELINALHLQYLKSVCINYDGHPKQCADYDIIAAANDICPC